MTTLISDDVIEIISSDDEVTHSTIPSPSSGVTREVCIVRPYTTPSSESTHEPKKPQLLESRLTLVFVCLSISEMYYGMSNKHCVLTIFNQNALWPTTD